MRALILGGGGAIGSAIARHADATGLEVHVGLRRGASRARLALHPAIRCHDTDVRDTASVGHTLAMVRPDWLVMAALPAGHPAQEAQRRAFLHDMCDGVLSVLPAARMHGFEGTLTWIGSAMTYGVGGAPRHTQAPLRPQTFRGAVKAAESLLVAQLASEAGIALREVRVFTGYGPYEQRDRFVASLLRAALTDGRVRLAPQPARRDWIHYDDIARACLATAALPPHGPARIFNACSGTLADTRTVATMLEDIVGRSLIADAPYEVADAYGDVEPGVRPDPSEGLDWSPRHTLAEGLAHAWEWATTREGRDYLLSDATA
ncbi:NAD-dependent epimerase/dehydratase [Lysobacter sp. KIS68-7]|uniref:NAD-dependent epimerase/dehydratase family protein n=1 Tax=Lysobacter sp. KIS68-7 TaxID=2904252 RepID=UPI001E564499|nr:NAD-dependent epimerase/dehydratase family protein [Lysobacter sp. KIS68-7]UHQ19531.1 NAD-dependent epimerase/dehydratase [Lysobacter sp. KIS68-7]